jgi:hypothetical protein
MTLNPGRERIAPRMRQSRLIASGGGRWRRGLKGLGEAGAPGRYSGAGCAQRPSGPGLGPAVK